MKHKAHYGEQFPLTFQVAERELLLRMPHLNPRLAERLRGARLQSGRLCASFTADEVDELVASVTTAVHEAEEEAERQAFEALRDRLGGIQFVFDDSEDEEL
jgi:hypothetical protein